MRNTSWIGGKFWFNAGLSLSVAGMPWTAAIGLLGTSTLTTLIATPVQAATLSNWEFDPATQELLVTVPGGTEPRYFLAAEPARIVLDLPNTAVGTVPLQQTYGGAIREIRVAQFAPEITRIVLELAPGTVLAPGHVELQPAGEMAGETGDRWVLRPLLATNATVATALPSTSSSPNPAATAATPSSVPDLPVPTPGETEELPPLEPGATEIPVAPPDSATTSSADNTAGFSSSSPSVSTDSQEPDAANEVANVGQAPETDPSDHFAADRSEVSQPEANQSESVRMPFEPVVETTTVAIPDSESESVTEEAATDSVTAAPVTQSPEDSSTDSPEDSPEDDNTHGEGAHEETVSHASAASVATLPELPDASPGALPASSNSETVSVPPLGAEQMNTADAPTPLTPTRPQSSSPTETPGSSSANFPTPSFVSPGSPSPNSNPVPVEPVPPSASAQSGEAVVPQPTPPTANVAEPPSIAATPTTTTPIEFGQPLPKSASNSSSSATPGGASASGSIAYSGGNSILLPAGTTLNLRYPGETPLELVEGAPRQEVLVLAEAVRDAANNVVLPEGSYVMGRFETGENGTQFVTQAISLQGQSMVLNAESEPLSGGRSASQGDLLRNSALGVAAGLALSITGVGLIPAIAAGAATAAGVTFLPESRSNTVQPDQELQVRLTQDLTQVN